MSCNRKLFLIILCIPILLMAQNGLKRYPFMKLEYNRLFYGKDSSDFMRLFQKMKDLKSGKALRVGVAHFGGSHVQAGVWSSTFVNNLQKEFNTNGGGYFVFPYRIAKTNGQSFATSFSDGKWKRYRAVGKEYCLPLGMCALSVSTRDSANSFGVKLTDKALSKSFTSVKVYHNFNAGFRFRPDSAFCRELVVNENKEQGYTQFSFPAALDSVNFRLLRADSLAGEFILFGFSLDNQAPGFYLAGLGANGAASDSFIKCFDLSSQFKSLDADLVILSLGVNDTQSKSFGKEEFIENYDSLIMVLKSVNPGVAIILTTTSDNYIKRKRSNSKSITAQQAMYELMDKHNLAVWDLFSLMGGYKSMLKWQQAGLASKDRVHFMNKGYILLGDLMFEALMKSYTCNTTDVK